MAGPGTTFTGPVLAGTKKDADASGPANIGSVILEQDATIAVNGANAVTVQFAIPQQAQILDIIADTLVAWNAGTSSTLTAGLAAAGTDYASGVSTAATGRVRPTFTAGQLNAMQNVGANTSVFVTITPVGTTPTTGSTLVSLIYTQQLAPTAGAA